MMRENRIDVNEYVKFRDYFNKNPSSYRMKSMSTPKYGALGSSAGKRHLMGAMTDRRYSHQNVS